MKRVTFYGQEIDYTDLSHQHLSNIVWYNEIFLLDKESKEEWVQLNDRFGGIKLPYKPMISFPMEVEFLEKKGMLKGEGMNKDVYFKGNWIGKLIYE